MKMHVIHQNSLRFYTCNFILLPLSSFHKNTEFVTRQKQFFSQYSQTEKKKEKESGYFDGIFAVEILPNECHRITAGPLFKIKKKKKKKKRQNHTRVPPGVIFTFNVTSTRWQHEPRDLNSVNKNTRSIRAFHGLWLF